MYLLRSRVDQFRAAAATATRVQGCQDRRIPLALVTETHLYTVEDNGGRSSQFVTYLVFFFLYHGKELILRFSFYRTTVLHGLSSYFIGASFATPNVIKKWTCVPLRTISQKYSIRDPATDERKTCQSARSASRQKRCGQERKITPANDAKALSPAFRRRLLRHESALFWSISTREKLKRENMCKVWLHSLCVEL